MNTTTPPAPASKTRTACSRGLVYFGFWLLLLPSAKSGDLALGALAAAAASWLSVYLLPPASGGIRLGALLGLLPHFLWESVRGGLDVAKRAFSPSMPLKPGFVECPMSFPPGLARNTFASITSLMPGTVPVAASDGSLLYHCLDVTQPVVESLCAEQRLLARAFVEGQSQEGRANHV
ncbi:Na+/H+ antiporter subunit E [Paucibacter sp. B2R-40]|uniref:Na+/H+ antiporter subunit E n=1 Tax=Paucibacter sp. B2R-40 TaxID=2893554 RepID=UPI0021E3BAB2|nr:Na+/H+ antiporter subunit E [Paucibacter sp. B2R-40]MCV2353357.1 Na+/H+ antiporter subunit E [Paucibacter sp. B2R-40]